jgi:hypothetical protein
METSVRVLVTNRPRLLRALVLSTLSEQAGIKVVGETQNEQDAVAGGRDQAGLSVDCLG